MSMARSLMRVVLGCSMGVTGLLMLTSPVIAQATRPGPPELMNMADGTLITSAESWEKLRRPEIMELLQTQLYGRTPVGRPQELSFQVTRESSGAIAGAVGREVDITFKGPGGQGTIHLVLFVPAARSAPAPVMLLICNRGKRNIDPTRAVKSPFWPAERIVARGYAAAAFHYGDVAIDKLEGLQSGVFAAFGDPQKPRAPDAWGAIGAWAWGASRVLDYLETDADIDARRAVVVGHSRGGKTALWAGAQDERFAMAVSNESGAAGAALFRNAHEGAEPMSHSVTDFGYWYCPAFAQYVGRPEQLPFDQHMLIAAMAPRLVYVASAAEDAWSDPLNEHKACVDASPAWRLYGLSGFGGDAMPAVHVPVHEGDIGYHIRAGKHNLTEYDWDQFMDFADKHLRSRKVAR